MSTHQLHQMHKSYAGKVLDEAQAAASPLQQFAHWFDAALQTEEDANAMTLATVGPDRRPSTRIVLIKDFDARGIVWYTNYESRKGRELAANPHAALQFHWLRQRRVVRIEGAVEKISTAESDAYFAERPLGSRIAAWASPQSRVLADRAELQAAFARVQEQLGAEPPRPPHWGGYRLVPDYWEFWQGGADRLHDRLCYRQQGDHWLRERLAP